MTHAALRIASLARSTSEQVERDAFLRSKFFGPDRQANALEAPVNGEVQGKELEQLHATTPFTIIFAETIRVVGVEPDEEVRAFLDASYLAYRAKTETIKTLNPDSQLERVLQALDEYLFDRYGATFSPQIEQTANFGRFTVWHAIQNVATEQAS